MIVANEMKMLGGRVDSDKGGGIDNQQNRANTNRQSEGGSGFDDMDDDIPF